MRTLDLTLKTDEDVKRIAEWAVSEDVFVKYSELSSEERRSIDYYIGRGVMNHDIITRNLVVTEQVEVRLYERSNVVAAIIWACTPETEVYGLKLAQLYVDRLLSFFGILAGSAIRDIRWESAYQFIPPEFPADMATLYPDAAYEENRGLLGYDADDPVELQEEIDWYRRWYPRRDFCRKIYGVLRGCM